MPDGDRPRHPHPDRRPRRRRRGALRGMRCDPGPQPRVRSLMSTDATDTADAATGEGRPADAADAGRAQPTWQGQRATPTRVILLRHGQTPLSVQRRYSGRGNPELTELGLAQAAAAARRVARETDIAAIVSSPLTRTRQTADAAAAALGLDVVTDDGFIETDFGRWEGLTFAEAAGRDPDLHTHWLSDTSLPAPGGESFDEVARRVVEATDRLLTEYAGQTVLVVSHVTPIKSLLRHALDVGPQLLFRLHLDLASVSIAEFYPDGGAAVKAVNETAHLF
ncbi:bifunctional RNase H/acid phosphatase [Gordonia desulfuricans]|uniref:Bifunctional RNase H/acid phosphatase n=2 Tax=Gordonia desulfuricans TaxID=89051 RepID=A0A7K3LTD7_9ACTN|nr:bifunctional RNase H/acid phosphatase [Gordonia desulfuricans]